MKNIMKIEKEIDRIYQKLEKIKNIIDEMDTKEPSMFSDLYFDELYFYIRSIASSLAEILALLEG